LESVTSSAESCQAHCFPEQTSAVANLAHLTCRRPLPINGSGQTAPDLCCAATQVDFSADLCLPKAATWSENVEGAD
jgi:hypothetical protein